MACLLVNNEAEQEGNTVNPSSTDVLKSRQFILKLLNFSNLLNFTALALYRAAKIKPGQIERSGFSPWLPTDK